jgi:hypothetical protein
MRMLHPRGAGVLRCALTDSTALQFVRVSPKPVRY